MTKVGDPNEVDQFNPTVHRRSGYGQDKLAFLLDWIRRHPHTTLHSGEAAILLGEIDRLNSLLRNQ